MSVKYILTSLERDELKQIFIEALNESPNVEHKKGDDNTPALLTQSQVLELLGITLPTLLSWRKLGFINTIKINRSVRYKKGDIESIFEKLPLIKYSRNFKDVGL